MKPDTLGGQPELVLDLLADLEPERRIPGRNFTKADLQFYRVDGFGIALKTYVARGVLARWVFGRLLTSRECSAYRAAEGVAGLPEFLGRMARRRWPQNGYLLDLLPRDRVRLSIRASSID